MPPVMQRADSLREFLTGASSAGGVQTNYLQSLGNFASSTEAHSFGIRITNAIQGISIDFASGGCSQGEGIITVADGNSITWQDANSNPGEPLFLAGNGSNGVAESAGNASSFIRVTRTSSAPITGGPARITLTPIFNNIFGFDNVTDAQRQAGGSQYLATILQNLSVGDVSNFSRWVSVLGIRQVCNGGSFLGVSGPGTISISGSFSSWPKYGWVRISNAAGTLKEISYYIQRSDTVLTVAGAGRGLLGTSLAMGAANDLLDAVAGVALALDSAGVITQGSSIQTIADINTPPSGVTWKTGITSATGISVPLIGVGKQVGIWMRRHIPAGAVASPQSLIRYAQSFQAF